MGTIVFNYRIKYIQNMMKIKERRTKKNSNIYELRMKIHKKKLLTVMP